MGFGDQYQVTERLLAQFPAIICYWYRYSHDGVRIDTEDQTESCIGGYFLKMLTGKEASEMHESYALFLILYAEHELMHQHLLLVFVRLLYQISIRVFQLLLVHCAVLFTAVLMKLQWK